MLTRFRLAALCVSILFVSQLARPAAQAPAAEHWVATWASAQQTGRGAGRATPPPTAPAASSAPIAPIAPSTPSAPSAPVAPPPAPAPFLGFVHQTLRMAVRVSLGGSRIRVHLSNTYGTTPLDVGDAHVALRRQSSEIVPGSDRPLLFNGKSAVTIPVGAELLSDPVALDVPALGELLISVYVPGPTGPLSGHGMALQTTYASTEGDATSAASFPDAGSTQAWYWASAVDVAAPPDAAAIVAFGDSITDGATSTPGTNHSWPSQLAERLAASPATARIAIVNEGISGNKVLADGAGVSALARFDRDVLGTAGVRWLMLLEGINDIGGLGRGLALDPDALIGALQQIVARAHTHGIKVIGCTLTPYGGAGYATDAGEEIRARVNTFIRTSPIFDAVVDFDAVTRDPANPKQFLPAYNNTDHLHPNDAGYKAMADAVDLKIFATP